MPRYATISPWAGKFLKFVGVIGGVFILFVVLFIGGFASMFASPIVLGEGGGFMFLALFVWVVVFFGSLCNITPWMERRFGEQRLNFMSSWEGFFWSFVYMAMVAVVIPWLIVLGLSKLI